MDKGVYLTKDGSHSIFSEQFGESYHSRHGAIQESQHVFIDAGLKAMAHLDQVKVLEMGFGTGLNAFMSLVYAKQTQQQIHYLGFEAYPLSFDQIVQFNYLDQLEVPHLQEQFFQLHQSEWQKPLTIDDYFTFEKRNHPIEEASIESNVNVIFYDAFAPAAQPTLWERPMMEKMYDALQTEGCLVTYCAKGVFKRCLKAIGFEVEAIPGPPGKREMTRAWKK